MNKINELKKIQNLIAKRTKSIETYLFLNKIDLIDNEFYFNSLIDINKKKLFF